MSLSPRLVGIVLAVAAALATWALWPRAPKSPEAQVRLLVARCVEAAEKKAPGSIVEVIAEDFRGPDGTGKQELRGVLVSQLLRGSGSEVVSVFNPTLEVTVESDDAAAFSGTFVFARGKASSAEALPPGSVMSAYRIEASLRRRDDQWQVVRASYARLQWP